MRLAKRRRSVGREAVAPALLIVGRRQTRIKRANDPFAADCAVFSGCSGAERWRTPLKRAMRGMHPSLGEEEALRPHFDRARIGVELV